MKQTCMLLLFVTTLVQAEQKKVFVTVDKNNNLVFSDSPTPGSTELNIKDSNNLMLPVTPQQVQVKKPKVPVYEVAIAKPVEQETLRENNGTVYVSGQIKPMFSQGLRVRLYLDEKQVAGPTGNANFILHNIDRGEHQLRLELLNQSGKIIATSPITTFYLHKASIISPK